jgi:hypothetical protein
MGAESTIGGFFVGVLMATAAISIYPNTVDLDNIEDVKTTISKCSNGEYAHLSITSKIGGWSHGSTSITCTDGTKIRRDH